MPGPAKGSEGAQRIADAHRGSHEHDKHGGFASNTSLAQEAGRKGGEVVKARYGTEFYRSIGKAGGARVFQERGSAYYAEIGRKGVERRAGSRPPKAEAGPKRPVGRPRKSTS
jgi:general stress protein YciG